MLIQIEQPGASSPGPTFLQAGFRPFFLLAGLQAAMMIPLWLGQFLLGLSLNLPYGPMLWHGHEMVFGFASAAVAGFLLTAVPNWTGSTPLRGKGLAVLIVLWLSARLCFLAGGLLPVWLAAALDLAFLPSLGLALAVPLIKAGKLRNTMFLAILALLALADALVLAQMAGLAETGRQGLYFAVFLLLMMIGVIGGRIIPGFTQNGLRMIGVVLQPVARPILDKAALLSLAAAGLSWVFLPDSILAGSLSLLAALLHLVRLAGWQGWKTGPVPLLWILHVGYLWLPVGLLLLALSVLLPGVLRSDTALHALTTGAIASMVLGVMSRAALGHSGRALHPAKLTVAAYALVQAAALVRVFGVLVAPDVALWLSGLLWSVAFGLYVVVYAPICLGSRPDGKVG